MSFYFQVLGLIIIFGLIVFYYGKDIKLSKESQVFKKIMLLSYVVELLYLSCYVGINQQANGLADCTIYIKLYLVFLVWVFSLYSLYYIILGLKYRYSNKQTICDKKINSAYQVFGLFNLITMIIIFCSSFVLKNNIIYGVSVNLCYLFVSIYLLLNTITMLTFYKEIDEKKRISLLIILLINIISVGIGYFYNKIPALNSSIVLLVLFTYLTLENTSNREIERLKLELNYARENNFDKNKFLKNISHEIRTPLNTIDGFSQVILDSDDINSIKEDAEDIRTASKNIIDIINGLIDMSVIEAGELIIIKENYNVYDMFDNIEKITKARIIDNKIKLKTSISKDIPKVLLGDSERIEQVILSIITNSIKNSKKGNIKLEVNNIKSSNICRLKIVISDNGNGYTESELNNLFLNDNPNSNVNLVYAKKLLELMDGKLDIESIKDKGTTYTITLDQKIVTEEKEVKKLEKKDIKIYDFSNKKILLVDDNKLNIKVACKLLEPYKVTVVDANSGQECLDIIEKDTDFDLIFMDDLMPNMSGTETLEILKKIERVDGFNIPVVVLTANAISGMKEKYLNKGFDDYLAKPIDKYELNRILKYYFKDKK